MNTIELREIKRLQACETELAALKEEQATCAKISYAILADRDELHESLEQIMAAWKNESRLPGFTKRLEVAEQRAMAILKKTKHQ